MHAIAHGATDDEAASDGMRSDAVSEWESADDALPLSAHLSRAGSSTDGRGAAADSSRPTAGLKRKLVVREETDSDDSAADDDALAADDHT